MRRGSLIVPLSLAAMVALGYAGITGSSGSLTLSTTANEWLLAGSDRGLNISSLIGTYKADGTGCTNSGALVSAWQYDSSTGKWKTLSCTYDASALGYSLVTTTNAYEGVWLHAGTTGGSGLPVSEALGTAGTTVNVSAGWNLVSTGATAVTFPAIGSKPTTDYEIFKDVANGVIVYQYSGGTWKVWSPNTLSPAPTATSTGLSAYEGFWVKTTSAKTYNMVATTGTSSSTGSFDGGSGTPLGQPGGTEVTQPKDLAPDEAADNIMAFTPSSRFVENIYTGGESNITKTSRNLDIKTLAVATDANDSVGATGTDYNLSSMISKWAEPNGTDTTITGEGNAGFLQILLDSILPNGYVPATLKGYAANIYGNGIDLNATFNKITGAPGINYYLGEFYRAVDDYNDTAEGLYEDTQANRDNNNSGKALALSKMNAVKSSFDTLKSALATIKATTTQMKSDAENLYTGLVEENASAVNKNLNYVVTTIPSVYAEEDNKSFTLSISTGMGDIFTSATGYTNTLPNLNLVFTINGTNYTVPVVGSDDNLTDLNGTGSSFVQDINSTISGSAVASYVEVTGNNAGTNGWEVNISGKAGAGNFNLAYGWVSSEAPDENSTVLSYYQGGSGAYDVNLTVPDGHEFKAASPATYQVGTISFPSSAVYKSGDEINISFGSLGNRQDLKATVSIGGSETTVSNFFDRNISFVIAESDIGSTDAGTRQNLASKIATQINSKESNLSATSSGEVVTVSTKTRTDGNNTLISAQYGIETYVNGINYNTMISNALKVKNAITGLDTNMTSFVEQEGNSTGNNIKSLELNISAAYDSIYAFALGGSITNGNVYKDSLAKLYWNTDGVSVAAACSTSFTDGIVGWRLPTILELVSLFDTNGTLSSDVTGLANNTVLKSGKYLVADHNSSHGWRLSTTSLTAATLVEKTTSGLSFTCTADYYSNGDSAYKFNDYYYYLNSGGTTNRLTASTANARVEDEFMKVNWMRRTGAGAYPTNWTTDGKTSASSEANNYCTQLNMRLPTQAELRSLNLFFLRDYYRNNKSGNSLSNYFPYDFSTTSGKYFWKDGSTYGVLDPTMDIDKSNMFNQSAADGTAYKVICVSDR